MGIGSFISGAISVCAGCIKSIGTAVGNFAGSAIGAVTKLLPTLTKWAGRISGWAQTICLAVEIVSRICGLLQKNEKVEDLGARSLQAETEGITLDSCDKNFDLYMEKLRNIKLDPEKAWRPEEKMLAGCLLLEYGLEHQFKNMSTAQMWPIIIRNADFFTQQRLEAYARLAMSSHIPLGEAVKNYFAPEANQRVSQKDWNFIWDAEKELTPDATPNEITERLLKVEQACAKQDNN